MEEEDVNIPSKGYDLSFLDNLDDPNFDPFKTKSSVNNDISSTKESRPFPRKPKTKNNKISDVNHQKTNSTNTERLKVTSRAKKDSILKNNDEQQSETNWDEPNMGVLKEENPIKTKPSPIRTDTFKVKAKKASDIASNEDIQNSIVGTIDEEETSNPSSCAKKKLSRSGTFTKSDTDESSDPHIKDETKDVAKLKEKPKKTILSKLMIKSQRKMVRSKTISNIELDNHPQTPKTPSLDINALLESIHSSKVSEAANVFEFLETSNEDDEQKTPRKMSIDTSSYVVSPDFSIDEGGLLTPRRMSIDTTSYVVPSDFSTEETNTPRRKNSDASCSNKETDFPHKNEERGVGIIDDRLTNSLNNLKYDEFENESSSSIAPKIDPSRNDIEFGAPGNDFQMQYSMIDDSETLNSLSSLSEVPSTHNPKNESNPNDKDPRNNHQDRSMLDELEEKKDKALKLRSQISQLKEEISRLNRSEDLIENFKTTINELLSSREKSRVYHEIEKERISHEKSQLVEDLLSAENSYKDVKGKYERSRDLIIRYKTDEDNLKIILNDRMDKLREKEQRFDRLKCHAEDKVQQANDAIQQIQTNGEVEMARLATMLRKSELKVETLDQTMRQKSEESRELAQMCDELICCAQSKPRYTL